MKKRRKFGDVATLGDTADFKSKLALKRCASNSRFTSRGACDDKSAGPNREALPEPSDSSDRVEEGVAGQRQ